ncbi:B3 domain-containing protein Os03g0620400-like [Carex rostrata]
MKRSGKLVPRMNNFYVKMDSSLMHSMNIPQKFTKMFLGSMSDNIELEGPSGNTWHVKMMRSDNTFSLQSGWKEFVTANKIDENDFIVFTYKDNSSFKVVIYDRSGCEKVAPFFAKNMNTEPDKESEESNNSSTRVMASPHREVEKEIISLSSGSNDTDESSYEISTHAAQVHMTEGRVCGKRKQTYFVDKSTESDSNTGNDNRAMKASRLYVVPVGTHLTQAQEEIANRMARKAQKDSRMLVKILTQSDTLSNKDCRLRLPVGFACKVLKSEKKKITLLPFDLDKRSKTCTANYYLKNNSCKCIGKGWRKFVCSNGLKQGDLCLFELRKHEKGGILTMVVHFNRGSS